MLQSSAICSQQALTVRVRFIGDTLSASARLGTAEHRRARARFKGYTNVDPALSRRRGDPLEPILFFCVDNLLRD